MNNESNDSLKRIRAMPFPLSFPLCDFDAERINISPFRQFSLVLSIIYL